MRAHVPDLAIAVDRRPWIDPVNLAVAACGVLIFHAVSVASGSLSAGGGLGWDGGSYADMVMVAMDQGSSNTRTRPLIVLITRIPYALGFGIIESFRLLNYVYAFVLYLVICGILVRCGAVAPIRAVLVANLALCIAVSKMFGFYPTQIDLGALAVVTLAFYLAATDRRWLAGGVCVLATASREFGVAAPLYGFHRMIRQGHKWSEAAAVYAPSIATMLLIRWNVSESNAVGRTPFDLKDAAQNITFWLSPSFHVIFVYFAVTVFGGVTALLAVRGRWCVEQVRKEPELATFLLIVLAATVVGSLDIWRYLVFGLPVVMTLAGRYFHDCDVDAARRLLVLLTLFTVVTQRPFESMDVALYFRDWFPLYHYFGIEPGGDDLVALWAVRLGAVALMTSALAVTVRQARRLGLCP